VNQPRWQIWAEAARPRTLPAAVAPVVVGSGLAARDGIFDAPAAALCLAFALLIQIGTNFANDYFDFMRGADTPQRVGPRRAVAAGLVRPETMKRATAVIFATAFLVGLSLIRWGGPWLLVVGISSIVCGIAYTGGPWPLAYHGLGDIFVFVFFGLVAVGVTYFVQAGQFTLDAFLVAAPVGLLASNILLVNNYRDVETDARAGKRTLVVQFGRGAARCQFAASLAVAFVVPGVMSLWRGGSAWQLLPLLLVPVGWRHYRRLTDAKTPSELIALLGDTGKFLAAYALLLAAGLVL
jgi:1,4-dihydroxy-2-naphthoate octaprenyltransferase